MKKTRTTTRTAFKKGALLLFILTVFIAGCQSDENLDPQPVSAKQKQNPEINSANARSDASFAAVNFVATLSGKEENPPVDTKARGNATFHLKEDGLHYKLIVANIENVTMAHIHLAPVGQNGGVVVWLYPSGPPPVLIPGTSNGILATGVITTEDLMGSLAEGTLDDLIMYMREGGAYVNVHTSQFGGGEIRGQIKAAGR